MSNPEVQIAVSREATDVLLARPRTLHLLRRRLRALEEAADDIARFCPWPALEASLRADADRVRAEIHRRT